MRWFIIIKLRVIIFWFSRLAKAEDDHQVAIAEKLDLEARLKEELEMTKVFSVLKPVNALALKLT